MGQYFLLILKVFQITFRRNSEKKKENLYCQQEQNKWMWKENVAL